MVLDFLKGREPPNAQSMKENLNLFNMQFEEICSIQSTWYASNKQLSGQIIISLQNMLPEYGIFIGR